MIRKNIEVRTTKDNAEYRVNGIFLVGNLTNDCPPAKEVEVGGEKRLVINSRDVSIACDFQAPGEDGKWQDKTEFHTFTLWGPRGKYFQTFKKGDQVAIAGYIKMEEIPREENGKKFTIQKPTVIIEDFDLLRRKSATTRTEKVEEVESLQVDGVDVPF